MHLGFRALDEYQRLHGYLPAPGDLTAANEVYATVQSLAQAAGGDTDMDAGVSPLRVEAEAVEGAQPLLRWLSLGSRSVLSPMAAAIGGIVGQVVVCLY